MKKPEINNVRVQFSQEGNAMGSTDAYEFLEVSLEFQDDENAGCYYVLKTETGWSFDDISEVKELIDRCTSILKTKGKKPNAN